MRLQEVYFICKTAVENWVQPQLIEYRQPAGNITYGFKNFNEFKTMLDTLTPITLFSNTIMDLIYYIPGYSRNTSLYQEPKFSASELKVFQSTVNTLKLQIQTIVELLSDSYDGNNIGVDIKLPANLSLSDMSRCIKDLDKIFSQCPLFWLEDTRAELYSVDRGSIWINIAIIGTLAAVFLDRLAVLVDKILILRSHHLTNQEQLQHYKQIEMQTELLDAVVKANTAVINFEMDAVVKELSEEYDINNPEDQARLVESAKTLFDLSIKGLEIYKAIGEANKDVKAVFPSIERQSLSDSEIKMLQESKDKSGESE